MLDGTEFYVVVKLTTGEQMMAVLLEEDEEYIEIEYPMVMRTTPNIAERKEHVTAHPFCQYSDDTSFVLSKTNVMFVKKLHHAFIPHYQQIVEDTMHTSFLTVGDEETGKWIEEETQMDMTFFIDGNETKN